MMDKTAMQEHKKSTEYFLPVLPLKNLITLPKSIIPVVVGRDISIKAVDYALSANRELFVTAQKSTDIENPTMDDLFKIGTRSSILQVERMQNGTMRLLVEGISRAEIIRVERTDDFFGVVACDLLSAPLTESSQNVALWRSLVALFKEYVALNPKLSTDVLSLFRGLEDLDYLADTVAVQMQLDFDERRDILELVDIKKRANRLILLLKAEIEILKAEKSIRKRVQSQVEKHQKDYYLNEQLRAIQRELGREDYQMEINDLRTKAKKNKLPKEAADKVETELKRLDQMQPTSPEATVSRNYVEWVISLPWHKTTKDKVSIKQAEDLLDASHAGMKKPKERIIEFLAARKFAGDALSKSPIICLVGPPGVGKTSLALSIAKSLGREMVRISLGGMRDEAEIRGHRRTYIGAMPGKIVQSMRKAGVVNPVIVLDEIDKMAMDFRGDPASALLEVLDPEQNKDFTDYFLEIGYDLSKVMFIATANVIDNIPYPLLDRMDMISLSGYTENEKVDIAKAFLIPKLLKEHALAKDQVQLSESLLRRIIDEYTKEAGVRSLERILAKLMRKVIQQLLAKKQLKKVSITDELVEEWFGVPPFRRDDRKNEEGVGIAVGLAWTEVGGDTLYIEVSILKGKGALTLTGQLGEVMQESAQAAMSYIRSREKILGLKEGFYSNVDVHMHLPEGAIPKDGPSAGITMVTALVSALTNIPARADLAMTGEVTLRGRVLAIGGLKEKLLAAIRLGMKTALVPKANARDVKEFEQELEGKIEIVFVDSMDEVLKLALVRSPFDSVAAKSKKAATKAKAKAGKKPAAAKKAITPKKKKK